MIWFTLQLDDKPGALARMAAALGERGINISAIVGIAGQVAAAGGTVRTLSTVRRWTDAEAGPLVEIELEVEGVPEERVTALLE